MDRRCGHEGRCWQTEPEVSGQQPWRGAGAGRGGAAEVPAIR